MKPILEVLQERQHQDEKWGGPQHDDLHTLHEWNTLILGRLIDITKHIKHDRSDDYRQALIEVSALAIAAAESSDRKSGEIQIKLPIEGIAGTSSELYMQIKSSVLTVMLGLCSLEELEMAQKLEELAIEFFIQGVRTVRQQSIAEHDEAIDIACKMAQDIQDYIDAGEEAGSPCTGSIELLNEWEAFYKKHNELP
ncbi:MAG: hypothetical protein RPU13_07720 [Candidatus Sedimenticola sp. (ex Thyasira tokunagai)]